MSPSTPTIFFLPVDPATYFEAHPLDGYRAPSDAGLAFDRCVGCGCAPSQSGVLIAQYVSVEHGLGRQEVSLPYCEACLDMQSRRGRLDTTTQLVSTGAVLLVGLLIAAVTAALIGSLAGALVGVTSTTFLFVFVRPAVSETIAQALVTRLQHEGTALSSVGRVTVTLFTDPRKGEGAEFFRVWLECTEVAERFAAQNSHAIPSDVWDSTYERIT